MSGIIAPVDKAADMHISPALSANTLGTFTAAELVSVP
jgi:hypothetical protein